jgi:hypothetical protein
MAKHFEMQGIRSCKRRRVTIVTSLDEVVNDVMMELAGKKGELILEQRSSPDGIAINTELVRFATLIIDCGNI